MRKSHGLNAEETRITKSQQRKQRRMLTLCFLRYLLLIQTSNSSSVKEFHPPPNGSTARCEPSPHSPSPASSQLFKSRVRMQQNPSVHRRRLQRSSGSVVQSNGIAIVPAIRSSLCPSPEPDLTIRALGASQT